jgi:hypothetical protein
MATTTGTRTTELPELSLADLEEQAIFALPERTALTTAGGNCSALDVNIGICVSVNVSIDLGGGGNGGCYERC